DGLDGKAARAEGLASRFGARFDIETDAALVAALSGLAVRAGLPAWILAIGALRYLHLAAATALPWLRGALPAEPRARRRRKTVGALQIAVLLAALAALICSFAADAVLLRRSQQGPPSQQETGPGKTRGNP